MTEHTAVVRRPRGKGLRSRKAKQRKALLFRSQPAPIEIPPDHGPRR